MSRALHTSALLVSREPFAFNRTRAVSRNGASSRGPLRVCAFSPVDLSSGFSTRPYTIREGDCLWSIAQKRNIEVTQIKALNPGLVDATEDFLLPGDTIILPAGKLSTRDLEILAGIGAGSTRIYPVRKGETIDAIASNRNIPLSKLEALNPGVDLQALSGGEKILLPGGYYTVREKEMLSTVMPEDALSNPQETRDHGLVPVALFVLLVGAGFFVSRSKRFQQKLSDLTAARDATGK